MQQRFINTIIRLNEQYSDPYQTRKLHQLSLFIYLGKTIINKSNDIFALYSYYINFQLFPFEIVDILSYLLLISVVAMIIIGIAQYWIPIITHTYVQLLKAFKLFLFFQFLTFVTMYTTPINITNLILLSICYLFCSYYIFDFQYIPFNQTFNFISTLQLITLHIIFGYQFQYWESIYITILLCYDCAQLLYIYGFSLLESIEYDYFVTSTSCIRIFFGFMVLFNYDTEYLILLIGCPFIFQFNNQLYTYFINATFTQISYGILSECSKSNLLYCVKMMSILDQSEFQNKALFCGLIKYKHKLKCDKLNCFCVQTASQTEMEQSIFQLFGQTKETSMLVAAFVDSKLNYNILTQMNFQEIIELEYIVNRIHAEYKPTRLFLTLIRQQMIRKFQKEFENGFSRAQIRDKQNQLIVENSLTKHINNKTNIDSYSFRTYTYLLEQSVNILIDLCQRKREIFDVLSIQYQNPQYYLLDQLATPYFERTEKFEIILHQLIELNPKSVPLRSLAIIYYHQLSNQIKQLRYFKEILRKSEYNEYWNFLNKNQTSYLLSVWSQDHLVIYQHSPLFSYLMDSSQEEQNRSNLIGQTVESIIGGPVKSIHSSLVNRLIQDGEPRLLNKGFQTFYLITTKGYLKEVDVILRLGNSMKQLEFMAIISNNQNSACQMLLNEKGEIINYTEEAGIKLKLNEAISKMLSQISTSKNYKIKQLSENIQLLQMNAGLINMKKLIPGITINDKFDIENGLILIPKTLLQARLHQQQQQQENEDQSFTMQQINIFKYFLAHPKKCFVFSATFKLSKYSYTSKEIIYDTLNVYAIKEIKNLDLKMIALEVLLKQSMNISQIQTQSYLTSYTSYKSLTMQLKQTIQQNSESYIGSSVPWEESQFIVDTETLSAQKFQITLPMKGFPDQMNDSDRKYEIERYDDSEVPQLNVQQSIAVSQNEQLLSGLNSYRSYKNEETNCLIQQSQTQKHLMKTKQCEPEAIQNGEDINDNEEDNDDEYEDSQKEQIKCEVSIKAESVLKQEIEWIRSKVKNNMLKKDLISFQSSKPKLKQKNKLVFQRNVTDQDQVSSIVTEDSSSNSQLVNHIVANIIESQPQQLLTFYVISLTFIGVILGLVIANHVLVTYNYEHMFVDSINTQYPLNLMQDINLMQISIQKISLLVYISTDQSDLITILDYYKNWASLDYVESTLKVNYYEQDYHDFLQYLDSTTVTVSSFYSDQNSDIIEQTFITRYFFVQYMMQIMETIAETDVSEISTHSMHESFITLNYNYFINQMNELIELTNGEVLDRIEFVQGMINQFLISGLSVGFLLIVSLTYSLYLIVQWRQNIMRTYFLFQGLSIEIEELDSYTQELLLIDEFSHINYKPQIYDKQGIQARKLNQQDENIKLKNYFIGKLFFYLLILLLVVIFYFIPFSIFISIETSLAIDTNSLISTFGKAELAFSMELTVFLFKCINIITKTYSSDYILELETTFQQLQGKLENSEHYIVYYMPADPQFTENSELHHLSTFTNSNMCTFYENQEKVLQNCELIFDGLLTQGYTQYLAYIYKLKDEWDAEIFKDNITPDPATVERILLGEDFNNLIISYSYLFPLFKLLREDLLVVLEEKTNSVLNNATIITVLLYLLIISADIIIFRSLKNQFNRIALNVRQLLLIFTKSQISKNKHLLQVLSKQVTID